MGDADSWWLPADERVAAPMLLGAVLSRDGISVRITEVEAYAGSVDPASHAFGGLTNRNRVMFGPPARLYTYLIHTHTCANVITSPEGVGGGVLIRAGEVTAGLQRARLNRPGARDEHLARGPGNLCRALGITMADAGADLLDEESPVRLAAGEPVEMISSGPRVGVSRAADVHWRFWITGEPSVSAYRRSPRAPQIG